MKILIKIILFLSTFSVSFSALANILSPEMQRKVIDALILLDSTQEIYILDEDKLEINGKEIQMDIDLLNELKEMGLIDDGVTAATGDRTFGGVGGAK